jgi:hypothetical protein
MKAYEDAGKASIIAHQYARMTLYPNAGKKRELAYRMLLCITPFRSSLVDRYLREGERAFDGEIESLRPEYHAYVADPV